MPVASMSTFNLEIADQLAPRLRLFSVYEDTEAGLTAEWLSGEIRALVRNRCELLQDVWKLDLLAGFTVAILAGLVNGFAFHVWRGRPVFAGPDHRPVHVETSVAVGADANTPFEVVIE